jgi:hypothetical protein
VTGGALPNGLTLAVSGTLSGTPTQTGTFSFTARVADSGTGSTASRGFTIAIQQGSLRISTESLPPGFQGFAYSEQLQAVGGPPPYTWAVVSGTLPAGLTLTSAGLLQGTPTATGSANIRVRVTDNAGAIDARDLTVAVGQPIGSLSLSGAAGTVDPAQQLPLTLRLSSAYPLAVSGTLNLAFAPAGVMPADDPAVQFSTGGRTVTFVFPANSTTAVFQSPLMLVTGTVTGTISITGRIQNGPPNASLASSTVRSLAPQITSITAGRVTEGLRVQITGYSPERRVTEVEFGFDVRVSSGTQRVNLSRSVEPEFGNWYSSPASQPFGSTFLFEQMFTVQGDAAAIEGVTVTLKNTQGSTTSQRVAIP